MSVNQRTLLCQRGLYSLLEGAAIRYSAKKARNKLGIVYVAEAEEHLVFLSQIGVHSRIE